MLYWTWPYVPSPLEDGEGGIGRVSKNDSSLKLHVHVVRQKEETPPKACQVSTYLQVIAIFPASEVSMYMMQCEQKMLGLHHLMELRGFSLFQGCSRRHRGEMLTYIPIA